MTLREIENLMGVGALFTDGRRVATIVYEIRVLREFQQARGQQLDDAENYIIGDVLKSDPNDLSHLVDRALILKLTEDDGRAWECRLAADHQLRNTGLRGLRAAAELLKEEEG
jgi:uncharacterized protein YaeQ